MASSASSRSGGGSTFEAIVKSVGRQFGGLWTGSPMYRGGLARPRPEGLGPMLSDTRPPDYANGERVLEGDFTFAGASIHVGARGDPWDRPSPSRRFAVALHRFGWLKDLVALGEEGQEEALRLTLEWRRIFGKWNSFSWSPDVLERRLYNVACNARAMCAGASEAEAGLVALDLARQARWLLDCGEGPLRAAERACAVALAGAAMGDAVGESLAEKALQQLEGSLARTVLPDGGHASRSPQAALELLFDLLTLDDALVQWGMATPEDVLRAIDRLGGAVRFFTLTDGALPAMQGGEALKPAYVAAVGASEGVGDNAPPTTRNGYHRMDGAHLQVVVDAEPPAAGAWSLGACAQPLAIEVIAAGKRLIVNSGWSPDAVAPQAVRVVDAASTASLGDRSCGEPIRGFRAEVFGPRLEKSYSHVDVRRQDGETAVLLELAHDGWIPSFGLAHERRLYLDCQNDELRGEDRFAPSGVQGGSADRTRRFTPFTVRFHLHPDVSALLARDRKSVLLRAGGDDAGWWLRNDAVEVVIEPSVHYQDGEARRSSQIVLRGQTRLDTGAKIRWKLARAEAAPTPGAPPADRRQTPR